MATGAACQSARALIAIEVNSISTALATEGFAARYAETSSCCCRRLQRPLGGCSRHLPLTSHGAENKKIQSVFEQQHADLLVYEDFEVSTRQNLF